MASNVNVRTKKDDDDDDDDDDDEREFVDRWRGKTRREMYARRHARGAARRARAQTSNEAMTRNRDGRGDKYERAMASSTSNESFDSAHEAERLVRRAKENWSFDVRAHGARALLLPRRRCAGVDAHFPREFMVRYVLAKDEEKRRWVVPDIRGELPGRGVYVSSHPEALEATMKRHGFQMGFKSRDIEVPPTLQKITETQLRRRLREIFAQACQESQGVRAAGELDANTKHADAPTNAVRTVEDELDILLSAQRRILPNNWIILPRDVRVLTTSSGMDKGVDSLKAKSDEEPGLGYKLTALCTSELVDDSSDLGMDITVINEIREKLARMQASGDVSDAPVLVDVDDEVSFRLRVAHIKMKLWMRV